MLQFDLRRLRSGRKVLNLDKMADGQTSMTRTSCHKLCGGELDNREHHKMRFLSPECQHRLVQRCSNFIQSVKMLKAEMASACPQFREIETNLLNIVHSTIVQ